MSQRDYLLTGASGFLGKVIFSVLSKQYSIATLGRSPSNDYKLDLAYTVPEFHQTFETVVHASGKAHIVPVTPEEVNDFFAVNYTGTINLTKGLEASAKLPKHFVFISTVAVYGKDFGDWINERAPLLGSTPYAKSKIQAEDFLQAWCTKHDILLTILRLPLLVAANPPGNLGAMIRMLKKGLYVGIGLGHARKSMVLAEDVTRFIPIIRAKGGIYNLTDGDNPTMLELENAVARKFGKTTPIRFPHLLLKAMARVGDIFGRRSPLNSLKYKKLTSSLTFSDAEARKAGWSPRKVIDNVPI